MHPFPHRYSVGLFSGPSGHATLVAAGLPSVRAAPPREFDGPGDAWSPEHLLLAAVETCFLFTFRAVMAAAGLEFRAIEVVADGIVARNGGPPRFTEITLRPRVTVARADDRERALRAVARAEHACLVSRALVTPVHVEPMIVVESAVSVA